MARSARRKAAQKRRALLRRKWTQLRDAASEEEGRAAGERLLLEKLLRLKFGELPESAVERLAAASSEDLERWAERVFSATTVDEVFG